MLKTTLSALAITVSTLAMAQEQNYQAPEQATATDFIEIFETLSGKHPGIRKGHARGVCAAGSFTPSSVAQERYSSPIFDTKVPVVLRFSMGGGNPNADERAKAPRGIGVQFQLANGSLHQLAGLTTPMFAGKNPEQFLGLLRLNAQIRDGEAPADARANYFAANPEAAGQGQWLQQRNPAAEYTSASYYGIHTFFADTATGKKDKFRWQLIPATGEVLLTDEERETLPADFLTDRLVERINTDGAVHYYLQWVIGTDADATNDPSVVWPVEQREVVNVGTLTISGANGEQCTPINFDPNLLAQGVQASDDPVLALRSAAYAISFGKRLSQQ